MRAESSRVALQWVEEAEIIGSCQRCAVHGGSFGPGRNQDNVRRNKRADEQTTKAQWELLAGGLGQGSERSERKHINSAASGGNAFKDHPVQKFNCRRFTSLCYLSPLKKVLTFPITVKAGFGSIMLLRALRGLKLFFREDKMTNRY